MSPYECFRNSLTNSMSLFCSTSKRPSITTSLIEQSQTARNGFGAVQIVSYHDGCHVMFRLEFEDQIVDFATADGIKPSRWFVEQQNIRL